MMDETEDVTSTPEKKNGHSEPFETTPDTSALTAIEMRLRDQKERESAPPVNQVERPPIPIVLQEHQATIAQINKDQEISRLTKDNVILRLRLLLGVPNDFIYDEFSMSFQPPPKPRRLHDLATKPAAQSEAKPEAQPETPAQTET